MKTKVAIIITGISIALLILYGADVAVGGESGDGFLGSDHKMRGLGLGIPSIVLPIIAFFITLKKPSKILGTLMIISGILIVVGGAFVLATTASSEAETVGRNVIAESIPLIVIGALIMGLGTIKLIKY